MSLAILRTPRTRSTIVGAVLVSMLALFCAPMAGPAERIDDSAVDWLRRQLKIPADDHFYKAADVAKTAAPTSFFEFVRAFVVAYEVPQATLDQLARSFAHTQDPFSLIGDAANELGNALVKRHRESRDVRFTAGPSRVAGTPLVGALCESLRLSASIEDGYVAGTMIRLLISASPEGP